MRYLGLILCGLLFACATTRPSQGNQRAMTEGLETLADECGKTRVLGLCDSVGCELFWSKAVTPSLMSGQPLRSPGGSGGWRLLPGSTGLCTGTRVSYARSATFPIRRVGHAGDSLQIGALTAEGLRVFGERDVIEQFVRLGTPGDVADWWGSEPRAHPDQWLHPLSHWERAYLQAMTSPTVPAALRMRPPLTLGI